MTQDDKIKLAAKLLKEICAERKSAELRERAARPPDATPPGTCWKWNGLDTTVHLCVVRQWSGRAGCGASASQWLAAPEDLKRCKHCVGAMNREFARTNHPQNPQ